MINYLQLPSMWSAQTIADLYRCRWGIEVFFKGLKILSSGGRAWTVAEYLLKLREVDQALKELEFLTCTATWMLSSASNWERGTRTPSRRMKKRFHAFLNYAPKSVPQSTRANSCDWKCEMCETTGQLCLFERICK